MSKDKRNHRIFPSGYCYSGKFDLITNYNPKRKKNQGKFDLSTNYNPKRKRNQGKFDLITNYNPKRKKKQIITP